MRRRIVITTALLVTAGSALAQAPSKFNEDAEITQIARGITTSMLAVACQLRTDAWLGSVLVGYAMRRRTGVEPETKDTSDDAIDARVADLIAAAKTTGALDTQFAAPSPAQCDALGSSKAMTEMDAAAHLGSLFDPGNQPAPASPPVLAPLAAQAQQQTMDNDVYDYFITRTWPRFAHIGEHVRWWTGLATTMHHHVALCRIWTLADQSAMGFIVYQNSILPWLDSDTDHTKPSAQTITLRIDGVQFAKVPVIHVDDLRPMVVLFGAALTDEQKSRLFRLMQIGDRMSFDTGVGILRTELDGAAEGLQNLGSCMEEAKDFAKR